MPASSEAPGWRTQSVKADAWQGSETNWDIPVLLDLLLLTASSESLPRLVPELVSRIVPAALRSGRALHAQCVGEPE